MDFKTIKAALSANCKLSANGCFVMIALASLKFNEGDECKATIADIAAMCKLSVRTVKYTIAELKKAGAVSVKHEGKYSIYEFGEIGGGTGEDIAPVGGVDETACECVRHGKDTREKITFEELTEADAVEAGSRAGVSPDVARQVFADMKANGGGYMTRGGAFAKVTGDNLQAAIRAMSKHAKPTGDAAARTEKRHTAAEIANAVSLCAERCAMFKAGKCGAGVSVLPAIAEWPHPPEQCKKFKALETKTVKPERQKGKA